MSVERQNPQLATELPEHPCPACGHCLAVPLYDGGREPLTTVALPLTAAEAAALPRLPLSFVRCVGCGHVFNAEFDYREVPYSDKPYFMFNQGQTWRKHLASVRDLLLSRMPERPVVVEIGCGDGHLLGALSEKRPGGRYVGFEPNSIIDRSGGAIEARPIAFEPEKHLAELKPDIIITRHVLEHLPHPASFLQSIAFRSAMLGLRPRLFVEVPCVDAMLATGRVTDLFYEHYSHFTQASFGRMLERAGVEIETLETGYGGEIVFALAQFAPLPGQMHFARQSQRFFDNARDSAASLHRDLEALIAGGQRVAIWGGSGKAAAFINRHSLDADRFPLVVDSDPNKVGAYVPGKGQPIRSGDFLREHPVDVILIATQWRAADIVLEIERNAIGCKQILLEHRGRLVDYFRDEHPYRGQSHRRAVCQCHSGHPLVAMPNFLAAHDAQRAS